MIYGAYGYTGELIARHAAELGANDSEAKPILAGRNAAKVEALAKELGFESRAFGLDDPAEVDAGLDGIDVVLHCAGPFMHTSRPMVEACLRTGTDYLDITGEFTVFEACAAVDERAKAAGVMVMPGVGFDVVPTDCLANHLKARLPSATSLTLAFKSVGGGPSHGTATTMAESLGAPNFVRRGGKLVPVRMGKLTREVDFGRGPKACLGIPWGDISTAYHSTGIDNIEVYLGLPASAIRAAKVGGFLSPIMKTDFVRNLAKKRIDAAPAGPTDAAREKAFSVVWGEARDGDQKVAARMKTPDGYTLTMLTGWDITRRVLAGERSPGFVTPAMQFGPDYICTIEGVEREEL